MIRASLLIVLGLASTSGVPAVAHGQGTPGEWRWRADHAAGRPPSASDTVGRFDRMPPGWHITTGPSGVLYSPAERASGLFSLVADFVVFPQTSDSGFGIFLGGTELHDAGSSYVAALLRRDGAVCVVRRARGVDTVLVPWATHSAIRPHSGSGTVTNRLRVNVSADSLRVFVNDSSVARIALESTATAGHFGFRVGEGVNLHLTILDHIRHLAPARSR